MRTFKALLSFWLQKSTQNFFPARPVKTLIEYFENIHLSHFEIFVFTAFIVFHNLKKTYEFECASSLLDKVLIHLQNTNWSYNSNEVRLYKEILTTMYGCSGEKYRWNQVSEEWKKLDLNSWQGNQFNEYGWITLLQDCLNLVPYTYSSKSTF